MKKATALVLTALLATLLVSGAPVPSEAAGVVGERTYKELSKAHELMAAGKYDEALERLRGVRTTQAKSYEKALVLQTYGYLYAGKGRYREAIDAFLQCLALDALPQSATKGVLYALAELQVATSDHRQAVVTLEKWLALEKRPKPEAHALAGWAYGQLERYDRAIEHLNKAIAAAESPKR